MARGCARIDSRPDTAKMGSADRVEVHYARLPPVIGVRKTFLHGLGQAGKSPVLLGSRFCPQKRKSSVQPVRSEKRQTRLAGARACQEARIIEAETARRHHCRRANLTRSRPGQAPMADFRHGRGPVSNGGNIAFVAFSQTSLETRLRSGSIPKADAKILASRAVVPTGLLTARIGWRASASGVGRCDTCQQLDPERD